MGMIYTNAISEAGKIIDTASVEGFTLGSLKMVRMNERQAMQFAQIAGKKVTNELMASLCNGNVIVFELIARKSIVAWQNLVDMRRWNAFVHSSSNNATVEREYAMFFGEGSNQQFPHTATLNNCTLAIIKPHVYVKVKLVKYYVQYKMQGCKLISISLSLYIYIEISYLYYIQYILTYTHIYIYQ